MAAKWDTYEDFAAWRDTRTGQQTVGDAMRRFDCTPLDTILAWWKRHKAEVAAQEQAALEVLPFFTGGRVTAEAEG